MADKSKHSAFSIIELLVVIVIIASLIGLAIPAIDMIQQSYNSTGSEQLISSALATARTIAMNNQRYAGIRFQKAAHITDDVLEQNQYMIFIVHDREKTGLVDGFCTIEGYKPVKLPENIGAIDMTYINRDTDIDDEVELIDATAFSIIFSPSGKLIVHDVRVRNKDGKSMPANLDESNDDIFNSDDNIIDNKTGMFIQDDYFSYRLEQESSRNSFVIYDRRTFATYFDNFDAYSEYLENLETIYINAYTGAIIERKK